MAICGKCHRDAPDGALFCSFCGDAIKPVTNPGQVVDPLIGQTVAGKYFIHQLLGHGGMGDVYKATHLTLDRPVVLKLLKKTFNTDPSLTQRFHREARAASRLNHPNSITIIDFGQMDDGTLFMAMEYLAGRSLERVIADEGAIPERRVVHMGAQILAALGEAHPLGIIHRDLKPANVMIEPRRDEPDFVKVLDFGIAKLNEPGEGGAGLTQAGIVCGTPGYMSPEQVRGEELDARSDVYAVGVILYEMLTSLLPFASDTPMGLMTRHLVEDPPPLTVRKPGITVSPELEAIVMRALARDRRDRFASAEEMRAALLACSSPGARSVRPTPLPSSTMMFDAGGLPQSARPATGSSGAQGKGSSAPSASELQGRMTAALPPTPAPAARQTTPPQVSPPAPTAPASAHDTAAPPRAKPESQPLAPATPARPAVDARRPAPAPATRSKVPLLAAAAAAGVLVLALAVWGLSRGSSKPAEIAATPLAPAAPAAPAPGTQAAPVAAQPTPVKAELPVREPAAAPSPPPSLPVPTPPANRVAAATPPTPKRPVKTAAAAPEATKGIRSIGTELNSIRTPPASSGDGVLTVVATPWAQVAVDGRDIGETPRELRLGAGLYRVRASHPVLGIREHSVTIKAGKRMIWSPTFGK
jgi:serine/threonine-protein kinase